MKDIFSLKNKTVIITGGAGLIGSAFSRACAESQANTVIVETNPEKAKSLAEKIKKETKNKNVIFQVCDITDEKDIAGLIRTVLKRFKTIDGLVNSAYPKNKNFGRVMEKVEFSDFCQNLNMHLGGYFLMTQKVAKVMQKQKSGSIVNMGSMYGFAAPRFENYRGTPMTVAVEYPAIKGGVLTLTKYLASYLGKENIRVNAISPGGVFDNQPKSFIKKYCQRVVLGKRMANPDDLTGALIFLLSDASKYLTGQNIVVDGGWTL